MFSGNTLSKSRKPLEQKDVFDLITSTGDIRTTTKKWAQSSDCASWRVPADSVYFIAGQISNMIGCDLLDYIQGRIEVGNNPVAYAGVGSTTGTHTIQVSTIQKLKEGDMVRMDPWTGAADKKVKACLHIVRMLNLSGGGRLKLIYSCSSSKGDSYVFGDWKSKWKKLFRFGNSDTNKHPYRTGWICGRSRGNSVPSVSGVIPRIEGEEIDSLKKEHQHVLHWQGPCRCYPMEKFKTYNSDVLRSELGRRHADDQLCEPRKPNNSGNGGFQRKCDDHSWIGGVAVCQ